MVALETVEADEEAVFDQRNDLQAPRPVDILSDMTRYDAERLQQLIGNHAMFTGSARAKALLADWPASLRKFRKVMPIEYRRALAELSPQMMERPVMAVAGE
jgi:glutamate synthase (NADPH/NADH) large chain